MSRPPPWIGVDLDGTLAVYAGWKGPEHIGEPVPAMLARVHGWLAEGKKVKLFTARAGDPSQHPHLRAWLDSHQLHALEITDRKDYGMVELWDDRCVQVVPNTGEPLGKSRLPEPVPVTFHLTERAVPGTAWRP